MVLSPEKESPLQYEYGTGCVQEAVLKFWKWKNHLRLPGSQSQSLVLPVYSLVATPTEISHPYNKKNWLKYVQTM
jgi:hypothetical protein